jgi:hypothetical protein
MQHLQHTKKDNEILETCIFAKTVESHSKHTQHPDKTLATYV